MKKESNPSPPDISNKPDPPPAPPTRPKFAWGVCPKCKEIVWEGDNIYEIPGIPVSFAHKVCEVREVQENDNKAR